MIALIVAYANRRVIGRAGKIPWKIEGEQARFRELTTGNVVVMGRRTYEEIGHPLPERMIYVVSRTGNFDADGVRTVSSLQEAFDLSGERDVYISGGERLYREALPLVEKMYITEISLEVEGDTFFPEFEENDFERVVEKTVTGEIHYQYVTYTRK